MDTQKKKKKEIIDFILITLNSSDLEKIDGNSILIKTAKELEKSGYIHFDKYRNKWI